jgi:hypothetical protein
VADINSTTNGGVYSVALDAQYAYLYDYEQDSNEKVVVFDISDPTQASFVQNIDTASYVNTIVRDGNYIYFGTAEGIEVFQLNH